MFMRSTVLGAVFVLLAMTACSNSADQLEVKASTQAPPTQVTTSSQPAMPTTAGQPEIPATPQTSGAFMLGEAVPLNNVVQGMKTSGGSLWAWGEDEIWRYSDGAWAVYSPTPSDVGDLAYDGDTLWVVTEARLLFVDGDDWAQLAASPSGAHQVEADSGTGIVWVSTGDALYRWDGTQMTNVGDSPYYVGDIVVTHDGGVWASGNFWGFGGFSRYDDATSSWEVVRPLVGDEDIPAFGWATTPDGSLWVLLAEWFEDREAREAAGEPTAELTLAHRNGATGEWSVHEVLPEGFPLMMAADVDALWLAHVTPEPIEGVMRFDGDTWTHYDTATPVADIAVAPDGTIWAVTEAGELRQLETMPTAALSTTELRQWQEDATGVADSYWGAWPDTAIVERLADDVAFYMPSDGDLIEGKSAVGSMLRTFIGYYAGAEPSVEAMFLSADAAAYHVGFASGLWPPWTPEPPAHPPFVILDVFRFRETAISGYEVWLEDQTLEMAEYGCFAIEDCPEADRLVERYVAAWESGDIDQIAALYADDAVFTDSLLGIAAVGPEEISRMANKRFGSGKITFELFGVYGQTNGYRAPIDESPDLGRVVGIGIHYRVSDADTGVVILESLTTFELGTWQPGSFDRHPDGLITREEVFHDPDTLADLIS